VSRNPVILGRKHCSRCGRWRHICDFACVRREPFKLQAQCRACARQVLRKWHEDHPEARSRHGKTYRQAHLEEQRTRGRVYQERRRKDPATAEIVAAQARATWQKMREDPERWAERLRKQRERYAVRAADPKWAAEQAVKRHRHYHEQGGREEVVARRARFALRRKLAVFLVSVLRAELERREVLAREERERKRARYAAWIAERRRRWEAGEFDDLEPVVLNGSLERLPAAPLAAWIARDWRSLEQIADESRVSPRNLRRYTTGESVMVGIDVVDTVLTRVGVLMLDVYDPGRYPQIYEVGV
jgi:hypothetical protein